MRPGVPYVGVELSLYEEAMRLVPAVTLARSAGRADDVLTLFRGFVDQALTDDIHNGTAWSIFAAAALAWNQQLYEGLAKTTGVPIEDLLARAIAAAATWVTSDD